jgi:hypothetical protein
MKNKRDAALLNLARITAAAYLFKKRGKNFDNLTTHCLLVAVNNIYAERFAWQGNKSH